MTEQFIIDFGMNSIKTTLLLSAPMLGFGLLTGLVVSIFQAVTSIQELTLTFIPKILAVFLALFLFFPWLLQIIIGFTENILSNFPSLIG
ncbi:Flagellar biosynthetic protein FliQ, export component [Nitrospina gracilis 3/211]|uniref:Flagellar biosynthetic protein FliQ n=1 Tax=Nitrospina gracilis (strain 3/211) TaxID=1266370 RepID=M1YNC5_NITG3|nr:MULTISPECIES: flagellar biosynthesis protein FliQ [Nitrospina]MCF8724741.1 flagellar biosynthetic protein FliQ [Nitrospina sp. Nb-3]CCQ92015.1 Flagellar biosynthetic protein FliQ, export component [Nitrospina gracilis 3/211]